MGSPGAGPLGAETLTVASIIQTRNQESSVFWSASKQQADSQLVRFLIVNIKNYVDFIVSKIDIQLYGTRGADRTTESN